MPKPDVPDHDPYLAADGSGVLENLLGLNKPDVLRETEFRLCRSLADDALAMADRAKVLDEATWRKIHHMLFGELYGWAGKYRTVNITKGGTMFAPADALNGYADKKVLPRYHHRAAAAASDDRVFAEALAECWGELNFLHPFREGNGRTTQIFLTALARRHGRSIDWSKVDYQAEIEAAKMSIEADYTGYERILKDVVGPR